MIQSASVIPHLPESRPTTVSGNEGYRADRAAWQAAAVAAVWFAVIVAAHHARTGPDGHRTALIVHLVSLFLGFGAVLAVDAYGLAVLAGRRTVTAILRFSATAEPAIWTGFTGLALSGIWLNPEFGTGWTLLNLYAVLIVGLNGVYARTIRDRLPALAPDAGLSDLGRPWVRRAAVSAGVSQVAWWTSIAIGTFAS